MEAEKIAKARSQSAAEFSDTLQKLAVKKGLLTEESNDFLLSPSLVPGVVIVKKEPADSPAHSKGEHFRQKLVANHPTAGRCAPKQVIAPPPASKHISASKHVIDLVNNSPTQSPTTTSVTKKLKTDCTVLEEQELVNRALQAATTGGGKGLPDDHLPEEMRAHTVGRLPTAALGMTSYAPSRQRH